MSAPLDDFFPLRRILKKVGAVVTAMAYRPFLRFEGNVTVSDEPGYVDGEGDIVGCTRVIVGGDENDLSPTSDTLTEDDTPVVLTTLATAELSPSVYDLTVLAFDEDGFSRLWTVRIAIRQEAGAAEWIGDEPTPVMVDDTEATWTGDLFLNVAGSTIEVTGGGDAAVALTWRTRVRRVI